MTDFNPILFYDLASELYKNITPDQQDKFMQATARTIISRAYYSAFLIARDQAGCTTQESPHSAVIGYFNKNKNQQYRKIANKLKDLRIRRNQSDYDLTQFIGKREAGESLHSSKEILQLLGKISA